MMFKLILVTNGSKIALSLNPTWYVNIGLGNDGTKPQPQPMWTQFYVTLWHH